MTISADINQNNSRIIKTEEIEIKTISDDFYYDSLTETSSSSVNSDKLILK